MKTHQNPLPDAQGTVEYLVVIAVVVVISLVVVSLVSGFFDSSSSVIGVSSSKIGSVVGSSGISVKDVVVDLEGDGVVSLSNFSGETISLDSVSVGGSVSSFGELLVSGDSRSLSLSDLSSSCPCVEPGAKVDCEFVFNFTTSNGLVKSARSNLRVDCVGDAVGVVTPVVPDDVSAPVVSLLSPVGGYETSSGLVSFSFSVSDNNAISSCSLLIGGSDVNSISSVVNGSSNSIDYNLGLLGYGTYDWDVNCLDFGGNFGVGDARVIDLIQPLFFDALWARNPIQGTGASSDSANSVFVDSLGNVYVTGATSGDLNFSSSVGLTYGSGESHFFLAKYDSGGNAVWARNAISGEYTRAEGGSTVFLDSEENIYVVGNMSTDLNFSSSVGLKLRGGIDFFVVKYDSDGTALWARNPFEGSGVSSDMVYSVFVDSLDNVFVVGGTYGDLNFSSSVGLRHNGSADLFIVKYDSEGNALWARNPVYWGGSVYGMAIYGDSLNNIYVAGNIEGDLNFSSSVGLKLRGGTDFFVVKYDSDGTALWARNPFEGSVASSNVAYSVFVDSLDNVFVAGETYGDLNFSSSVGVSFRGGTDVGDFFVVKYDSDGAALWATNPYSKAENTYSAGTSVFVDSSENVYLTGSVLGDINFSQSIGLTANTDGWQDFFVVKYDSGGGVVWVKDNPFDEIGDGVDISYSVFVDPSENVYVAGFMSDNLNFSSGVGLTFRGVRDFFVAKYGYQ